MPLTPGLSHETQRVVQDTHTAKHIGSGTIQVLGTPIMILWMEETSLAAAQPHLDPQHTTIGPSVGVQPPAAEPRGRPLTIRAELTEVRGRRLAFHVVARDDHDTIGEGSHERYIIDIARFEERVNAKR